MDATGLLWLIAALLLTACGLLDGGKTAAELMHESNELRLDLNALAADVRDTDAEFQLACVYRDRLPALERLCAKRMPAMRVLNRAWWTAWEALELYQSGIGTLQAAADLLDAVQRLADEIEAVTQEARRYAEGAGEDLGSLGAARSGQAEPASERADAGAESEAEAAAEGPVVVEGGAGEAAEKRQ